MSHETYRNGVLVERADDEARTVTTYDEAGAVTSTRPYTEVENQSANQAIGQAAINADLTARVEAIEAWIVAQNPVDPEANPGDVQDWPSDSDALHAHDAILPGALVRWPRVTGLVYRNASATPLGHSPALIPPETYPHLWQRVETSHDPEPDPEPGDDPIPWVEGLAVEVGDKVIHNGRVWECLVAHTTHLNWAPGPMTWAQWEDLGPA